MRSALRTTPYPGPRRLRPPVICGLDTKGPVGKLIRHLIYQRPPRETHLYSVTWQLQTRSPSGAQEFSDPPEQGLLPDAVRSSTHRIPLDCGTGDLLLITPGSRTAFTATGWIIRPKTASSLVCANTSESFSVDFRYPTLVTRIETGEIFMPVPQVGIFPIKGVPRIIATTSSCLFPI